MLTKEQRQKLREEWEEIHALAFTVTGPMGPEGVKPGFFYSPTMGYVPISTPDASATEQTQPEPPA